MKTTATYCSFAVRLARAVVLVTLLIGPLGLNASAQDGPADTPNEGTTVRYLGVGNSFTRNATAYLRQIAEADGNKLVLGVAYIGGGSLENHTRKLDAWEQDPTQDAAKYGGGRTLAEYLDQEDWDYVSIQQVSIKSHDPATYQPFADELVGFIRERDPQAALLIHQTWAYRADDPRFGRTEPTPGEPNSRAAMHEMLTAAYQQLATHFDARLVPVGNAFDLAETDPGWGFRPEPIDREAYPHPALPEQPHSLHVGWVWRKEKLVYDGHHASVAGRYLAGCVFYEVLFGRDVVGNRFVPDGMEPEDARFLQQTAHRAVMGAMAESASRR